MHLSDISGPFIVGYSLFGLPDAGRRGGRPPQPNRRSPSVRHRYARGRRSAVVEDRIT
jgi:hypothetical protein